LTAYQFKKDFLSVMLADIINNQGARDSGNIAVNMGRKGFNSPLS
jgi:hypothetical protein